MFYKFRNLFIFTLIGIFIFQSCKKNKEIGFYYWKTNFSLDYTEKNVMKLKQFNRIYIRYFDLDFQHGSIHPINPIKFYDRIESKEIIPVVYIKNRIFQQKNILLNELADKTLNFIQQINKINKINISEVQLDCDWTDETKNTYFEFVNIIKQKSALKLSVTIRLHQIKYYKITGIPNADDFILMYYNMGKIECDSFNSIYNQEISKLYLPYIKKYPRKLKLAFPIFSWYIHCDNMQVQNLYVSVDEKKINNPLLFDKKGSIYTAKSDLIIDRFFLKKNDHLIWEGISEKEIKKILNDMKLSGVKFDEIIFYDLQNKNFKQLTNEKIEKISRSL